MAKKIDFCNTESILKGILKCLLIPRPKIPSFNKFLLLTAKKRPGLSSSKTTASILSRRNEAGINPLSPEMEKLIRIMVEEIFKAFQQDAKLSISVDSGITLNANGGNAGGPISVIGQTILPGSGTGVIS
mgnify:CR=1 FL=1